MEDISEDDFLLPAAPAPQKAAAPKSVADVFTPQYDTASPDDIGEDDFLAVPKAVQPGQLYAGLAGAARNIIPSLAGIATGAVGGAAGGAVGGPAAPATAVAGAMTAGAAGAYATAEAQNAMIPAGLNEQLAALKYPKTYSRSGIIPGFATGKVINPKALLTRAGLQEAGIEFASELAIDAAMNSMTGQQQDVGESVGMAAAEAILQGRQTGLGRAVSQSPFKLGSYLIERSTAPAANVTPEQQAAIVAEAQAQAQAQAPAASQFAPMPAMPPMAAQQQAPFVLPKFAPEDPTAQAAPAPAQPTAPSVASVFAPMPAPSPTAAPQQQPFPLPRFAPETPAAPSVQQPQVESVPPAPVEQPTQQAAQPNVRTNAENTAPQSLQEATEGKAYTIPGEGEVSERRYLDYLIQTRDWNDQYNTSEGRKINNKLMRDLANKYGVDIEAEAKRLAQRDAAATQPTAGEQPVIRLSGRFKNEESSDALRSLGKQNPLNPKEIIISSEDGSNRGAIDASVVSGGGGDVIQLKSLRSVTRGGGREAIKQLIAYADKNGQSIEVDPTPFANPAGAVMSPEDLRLWYKQFGFTDAEGGRMVRKPGTVVSDGGAGAINAEAERLNNDEVRQKQLADSAAKVLAAIERESKLDVTLHTDSDVSPETRNELSKANDERDEAFKKYGRESKQYKDASKARKKVFEKALAEKTKALEAQRDAAATAAAQGVAIPARTQTEIPGTAETFNLTGEQVGGPRDLTPEEQAARNRENDTTTGQLAGTQEQSDANDEEQTNTVSYYRNQVAADVSKWEAIVKAEESDAASEVNPEKKKGLNMGLRSSKRILSELKTLQADIELYDKLGYRPIKKTSLYRVNDDGSFGAWVHESGNYAIRFSANAVKPDDGGTYYIDPVVDGTIKPSNPKSDPIGGYDKEPKSIQEAHARIEKLLAAEAPQAGEAKRKDAEPDADSEEDEDGNKDLKPYFDTPAKSTSTYDSSSQNLVTRILRSLNAGEVSEADKDGMRTLFKSLLNENPTLLSHGAYLDVARDLGIKIPKPPKGGSFNQVESVDGDVIKYKNIPFPEAPRRVNDAEYRRQRDTFRALKESVETDQTAAGEPTATVDDSEEIADLKKRIEKMKRYDTENAKAQLAKLEATLARLTKTVEPRTADMADQTEAMVKWRIEQNKAKQEKAEKRAKARQSEKARKALPFGHNVEVASVAGEPTEVTKAKYVLDNKGEFSKFVRDQAADVLEQYSEERKLMNYDSSVNPDVVSGKALEEFIAAHDARVENSPEYVTEQESDFAEGVKRLLASRSEAGMDGPTEVDDFHSTLVSVVREIQATEPDFGIPKLYPQFKADQFKGFTEAGAEVGDRFTKQIFRHVADKTGAKRAATDPDYRQSVINEAWGRMSRLAQTLAERGYTQFDPSVHADGVSKLFSAIENFNDVKPEQPGLGSTVTVDPMVKRLYTPSETPDAGSDNPFMEVGGSGEKGKFSAKKDQDEHAKKVIAAMRSIENKPMPAKDAVAVVLKALGSSNNQRVKEAVAVLKQIASSKIGRIEIKFTDVYAETAEGTTIGGVYNRGQETIEISIPAIIKKSKSGAIAAEVLAHEIVHYHTVRALEYDSDFKNQVQSLMAKTRKWMNDNGVDTKKYGMTNEKEFLAEGMANQNFRNILKQIPAGETVDGPDRGKTRINLFQRLVKSIKQMFAKVGVDFGSDTVLERVIELYSKAKTDFTEADLGYGWGGGRETQRNRADWQTRSQLRKFALEKGGSAMVVRPSEASGEAPGGASKLSDFIGNPPTVRADMPDGQVANHDDQGLADRGFMTVEATKMPAELSGVSLSIKGGKVSYGEQQFFEGALMLDGKKIANFNYNLDPDRDGSPVELDWINVEQEYRAKGLSDVIQAEILERSKREKDPSRYYRATVLDRDERPLKGMRKLLGKENVRITEDAIEEADEGDQFGFTDAEGYFVRSRMEVEADIPNQYTPYQQNLIQLIRQANKDGNKEKARLHKIELVEDLMNRGVGLLAEVGDADDIIETVRKRATEGNPDADLIPKPRQNDSLARQAQDILTGRYFSGISSKAHQNADRTQSAAVKAAANIIHARPGTKSEAFEADLPTATMTKRTEFQNRFNKIMSPLRETLAGFKDTDTGTARDQREMVYKALTDMITGRKPITQGKLGEAATGLKNLLADLHAYRTEAGEKLGNVNDYYPAVYDSGLIGANRIAFTEDATRAYEIELNKLSDEELANEAGVLPNSLQPQLPGMGGKDRKTVINEIAKAKADALYKFHQLGGDQDMESIFGMSGKGGAENPTASRTFSREAQAIMAKYQVADPFRIVGRYIGNGVKRAELVRRFGNDGKKWQAMASQMIAEGADQSVVDEMRDLIRIAAGIGVEPRGKAGQAYIDTITLMTAASAMGRGFLNNLVEPVSMGIRTGSPITILRAYGETWSRFLREVPALSPAIKEKIGDTFWQKYGEHIGTIHSSIEDAWMTTHSMDMNADEADPRMRWLTNRIYKANLMDASEVAKQQAAHAIGYSFIKDLASWSKGQHWMNKAFGVDPKQTVSDQLNELGIPPDKHAEFADWVLDLDKVNGDERMTRMTEKNEMALLHREAMTRFSMQSSVRSNRAHRPAFQDDLLGKTLLQLMNFSYSYAAEVNTRVYDMAKQSVTFSPEGKDYNAADRIRLAGPALGAAFAVAAYRGLLELKDLLYPTESTEKRSKDPAAVKWMNAASYAGVFGPKIEQAMKYIKRDQAPGGPAAQIARNAGRAASSAIEAMGEGGDFSAASKQATKAAIPIIKGGVVAGASAVNPVLGASAVQATNMTNWSNSIAESNDGKKPSGKGYTPKSYEK